MVEPPRTDVKLHRRSGSELMRNYRMVLVPCGLRSICLPCNKVVRTGSLCCTMVRTGSEELNHPELMRNYPMILVPSGAQWFEEVRLD